MLPNYEPFLERAEDVSFHLSGEIGQRLEAVTGQWLLPAPESNPAMLEMFRQRDVIPYRKWVPWAGEFAGKYLTHAVQILRLTNGEPLKEHLRRFVAELISCQADDGYLGCWPAHWRLANNAPNAGLTWDTWGHYHTMLGLLLWDELAGDPAALQAAVKIGDLICRRFLGDRHPRMVDTGSTEMNLAPAHSMALLYRRTGEERYLRMAEQLVDEFGARDEQNRPLAGDYFLAPLRGEEFFQTPKPRWESLHPIMGLAELYHLTGKEDYRRAFEALWYSIRRNDRHNNGGFSSGEEACGNPYDNRPIETCCTVAWMAMSVEMLRLTGDSTAADELELSLWNSGLGLIAENGRWVTYNTPMDGIREASAHSIVFQARAGASELNCCSVNGPRVLGLLAEWALMQNDAGLVLNYYGPGSMAATLPSGNRIRLIQTTGYPYDGTVVIRVEPERPEEFSLALRIPSWSRNSRGTVAGETLGNIEPGRYLTIRRRWSAPVEIRLELDFGLQFWRHPAPAYPGRLMPFHTTWYVIVPSAASEWDTVTDLDRIRAASVPFADIAGKIDFRIIKKHSGNGIAYCFTEITVPGDCTLPLAYDCGYIGSHAAFVNGKMVTEISSCQKGYGYCNLLRLPLQAGRNLLGFRVSVDKWEWASMNLGLGKIPPSPEPDYASIYRGPLLLAYDIRFNTGRDNLTDIPILAKPELTPELFAGRPVFTGQDANGGIIRYCPFAAAGAGGNYYQSWVPVGFRCRPAEFSEVNPRRSDPAN